MIKCFCKQNKKGVCMIYKFIKKLDTRNFIGIPKKVVEKFGKEYYMEVYEDKIVLIPVSKKD